jgi:hypothetical protein
MKQLEEEKQEALRQAATKVHRNTLSTCQYWPPPPPKELNMTQLLNPPPLTVFAFYIYQINLCVSAKRNLPMLSTSHERGRYVLW